MGKSRRKIPEVVEYSLTGKIPPGDYYRQRAADALKKIKKSRASIEFELVQIGPKTWVERPITNKKHKNGKSSKTAPEKD